MRASSALLTRRLLWIYTDVTGLYHLEDKVYRATIELKYHGNSAIDRGKKAPIVIKDEGAECASERISNVYFLLVLKAGYVRL